MSSANTEFKTLPREARNDEPFKNILSNLQKIQSTADNIRPIDFNKASLAFWYPFGNPDSMSLMIYDDNTSTENATFALIAIKKDLKLPYKMCGNEDFVLKSGGFVMVGSYMKMPFERDLKKRGIKAPYQK